MKKYTIIILFLIIVIGCQKSSEPVKSEEAISEEIKYVLSLNTSELFSQFNVKNLMPNPYEIVSEKVTESFQEFHKALKCEACKNEDIKPMLIDLIMAKLPADLINLPQDGYTSTEGEIYSFISETLENDDLETFITRAIWIEDIVNRSAGLSDISKKRILVYSAALKSTITFITETCKASEPEETWDECFRRKQSDMGFFESIACVLSWPVCLGAMAADCVLETQF